MSYPGYCLSINQLPLAACKINTVTQCALCLFFFKVTQLCTIYEYLSYWYIRVFIIFWSCTVLLLELFYEFLFFNAL